MAKGDPKHRSKEAASNQGASKQPDPLGFRTKKSAGQEEEPHIHVYHNGAVCDTDSRGYPTPDNRSPNELVLDATDGFIPLWARDVTLRWRFQERSLSAFRNPEAAKIAIRELFIEGLLAWEDAAPIKFAERHDAWEIGRAHV